ncbi:MAG: hypothetical protein CL549_12860 [Alcanivorax sp.]|nr:hypothetical protein [Alcanivorax sp.]MAY11357.1 hypothetical protein [Alcanivorax sp.]HCE39494.1 hypothetical protein [Alcanivorax sp.]
MRTFRNQTVPGQGVLQGYAGGPVEVIGDQWRAELALAPRASHDIKASLQRNQDALSDPFGDLVIGSPVAAQQRQQGTMVERNDAESLKLEFKHMH